MNERDALLILNAIPGLGNARISRLMEAFGKAERVIHATRADLKACSFLPDTVINNICAFAKEDFLSKEKALLAEHGVEVLTRWDVHYPRALSMVADAPVVLYVKGIIPDDALSLAIVGSRKASLYGLSMAEKFATQLSESGFTIISGLARGVDTAAHRGALKARGKTIAVLGSGLAHIYPPENESLFYKIAGNGAVISEFPMNTQPRPVHFPRRNRIVSALSLGVLIIEAALKSGALITADCALEQGKEVFALPGPVDSVHSSGVNNLIKQGAKLVTCREDILDELKPQLEIFLKSPQSRVPISGALDWQALSEPEQAVCRLLKSGPRHFDELVATSDSMPQTCALSSLLMELELKNVIRQMPGKFFAINQ